MPWSLRILVLLGLVGIFGADFARGQSATTNAAPASTNAASAAPAPVALSETVTSAVADSATLQNIETSVSSDQTTAEVEKNLPPLDQQIEQQQADDGKLLKSNPTLPALRTSEAGWQVISDGLSPLKQTLTSRIAKLDETVAQLEGMEKKWNATLAAAQAPSSSTPADVLKRVEAVVATVGQTSKDASALRGRLLSTQDELAEMETRVAAGTRAVAKAKQSAVNLLFTRDSAPLWNLSVGPAPAANPDSFPAQFAALRAYVAEKFSTTVVQLLVFVVLALALFWARRTAKETATDDAAVQRAAQVFDVPLAMAALLVLLISGWLYPVPPRLFRAGLGAAALVPAVIILRRLIEPSLFPILYAVVGCYFLDQLRFVLSVASLSGRGLLLFEMSAAGVFLLWLLRSGRLSAISHDLLERSIRGYAGLALAVLGVAVVANVLGYMRLSFLLGNAILSSSYLGVILYAAVRIADGLIMAALRVRPLSLLAMVNMHKLRLGRNAGRVVRWAALLFWTWETLELFSVRTTLWNGAHAILHYPVAYGSIKLSLGPILLFAVTIWATLLLSRFVRFVLEEEVYPKLKLGAGVPYAASTLVHYTVLVLGILFALAAVHIDLSQYSVLAGALGVGLGFGLQNIMNNFVSGIILLFERPIKVGDVIQVDTNVGTVQNIGIRASVIRITNGSEIIVPNGNLIANPVTNWTFSNTQRVIELPIAVGPKSEPQRVMNILVETAKAHPKVLQDPPPQVLFTSLTGTALNFELRASTDDNAHWRQIQSDLFLAISAALARENIATT